MVLVASLFLAHLVFLVPLSHPFLPLLLCSLVVVCASRVGVATDRVNLSTAGLRSTLRPVHQQAWLVVFSRFSRAKFPLVGVGGKINGPLFWELVLFLLIPGVIPLGEHLDSHQEGASSQLSASIPLGGAPSLAGSCPLGRGTALATVTTPPISQGSVFSFFGGENHAFIQGIVGYCWICQ